MSTPTTSDLVAFTLRNGVTVRLRPVRPDDEPRLLAFLRSLSIESRVLRYFSAGANLPALAHTQTHVDDARDFGLIATVGSGEQIVGHAMYARLSDDHAEVAFEVADEFQGQGLGTLLLDHLLAVASAHQVRVFEADVLPNNRRMLSVFRHAHLPLDVNWDPDQWHVMFPTSMREDAVKEFEHARCGSPERSLVYGNQPAFNGPRRVVQAR